MDKYPIYCGGEFISTEKILKVENPYNGEIIAETFLADIDVLETAIKRAIKVEDEIENLPLYIRYEILMHIAELMKEDREKLSEILAKEAAKPLKYAISEINRAIQTFIVSAEESKRLPQEYIRLDWTADGTNREGLIKYFPVGLVAGISPFNFPINLAVHKIAPAIAAGCPIILKPASSTPLSTLELAKIIDKTALPKGALSVLPMDRATGNKLVTDERFKLLTFTGSPEVGWKMKNDAGKKKVVLELGGNAGTIITKNCDIDYAVKRAVVGGFAYSGQICIHAQRFYIEDSIYNKFAEKFVFEVKKLKYGAPSDINTDITSMIDLSNAKRVGEWVNEAVSDGAEILCGGKRQGTYYEPTILTKTNQKMKVCSEEVFGPVVTIEKYSDYKDAVELINYTEFGLQAGVFTNNIDEMNYAFKKLKVGGVIINDVPTYRVDHMPYGGIKDSGIGREGVKYAIIDMMEQKILVKNF